VSDSEGDFQGLLEEHFGRRGWNIVHAHSGMEALARIDRNPPVACIFEHHVDGWREIVRELKCNIATNWVPIVGIFPKVFQDEPVSQLTVQPDELLFEPFDFKEFIHAAGSELADRVTSDHDAIELNVQLPGGQRDRREACRMIEEVLYRANLPEAFCAAAGAALGEALDNAMRHGHQNVECCTISLRMILDPRRLVLAVRDTGDGFDHAAALSAARSVMRTAGVDDPLARAAAALRTRRAADATQGGIARMLKLVDRVDYNRAGNEVVLTKGRPTSDPDTSTNVNLE
jgi:anti-sigma regulatory factor (Ser/Thr protein kinase)